MTGALELAQDAFAKAKVSGTAADWRQAAQLLYKIRRRPKQIKRRCAYPFPVAYAVFADQRKIAMAFYSVAGAPLDVERGRRVCEAAYRNRLMPGQCPAPMIEFRTGT